MTRKYRVFRLPPLALALLLAWGLLAAPLWAAETEAEPATGEEAVAEETPKAQPAPERRDEVFGTMDENIRMDRDPQTGDSVISVTPRPRPKPQYGMPPVTVEPRVQVPARGGQSQGWQGRTGHGRHKQGN
ncbi:hypothetical protein [Desulfocurvus sp. DL9XJH121]